MGWILHQAIVVTTFDKQRVKAAHEEAKRIFNGYVTEVIISPVNFYYSFLIPPDGSKDGWPDSDQGDERRAEFGAWVRAQAYEDGSNVFDAIEISYGGIDEPEAVALDALEKAETEQ